MAFEILFNDRRVDPFSARNCPGPAPSKKASFAQRYLRLRSSVFFDGAYYRCEGSRRVGDFNPVGG